MKIPYNVLHVSGSIVFAARGGKIHAFSLDEGTLLSTWKHPDVDKVDTAVKAIANAAEDEAAMKIDTEAADENENENENGEPPAKRQRVDESQETAPESTTTPKPQDAREKAKGKKSRNRKENKPRTTENQFSRVPDRPVITHLTSTTDGQHLVCITGHDKVIWVFKHDGKGILTELSKRTMPKRPSSVALGPDSQIICADKFGDVYSLPLETTASSSSQTANTTTTTTGSNAAPAEKPVYKPAANNLTVHSQRNLRALTNQQRQQELASRTKNQGTPKPEGPDFELTLLLGHVSMLTALILGESDGRRYILTADRDEHIRVSRYIPQAYVIERFCFGHKEFVSTLTIPKERPEVLISGGGDEDIFLWDWKAARLLSRTSILTLAQEIAPSVSKVSVSALSTMVYPTESGQQTYVIAICEDIPAIFTWLLTEENTLNHPGVIQLPGKPLDVAVVPTAGAQAPRLIVAIDSGEAGQAKSLNVFSLTTSNGRLSTESTSYMNDDAAEAEELEITEKEVRSLLYNVESMRKQPAEQGEEDGNEDPDVAAVAEQTA